MSLRKQTAKLFLMASLGLMVSLTAGLQNAAIAQMVSGDLVGTVTDSTGAAIPNATVTAVNTGTGIKTTGTSNGQGGFRFQNLLAGTYDVTASASGFTESVKKGFSVELSKTSTLDITLTPGGGATTVEVSADASVALDTTTVQLEQTFSPKELTDLPTSTVGLGVLNLALLSPGVASAGPLGAGTGPSVGGQRPRANNFTIEGIDNNDKSVTGPLVYVPNDAVGSFTLITNQFSPEFGHSAGGQFNTAIKSGTNSFHGALYEYFDNRDLNAENATAGEKVSNTPYDYNRYGGDVGGPIFKDKLFFFANYERQYTHQTISGASATLCTPTAAGLATLATLPNLNATNLAEYLKYTPASAAQVTNSNDAACFNSTPNNAPGDGQALEIYPNGTFANITPDYSDDGAPIYGSGTPTVIPLGNVTTQPPSFGKENVLAISSDYTISNNDNFRLRYVYNDLSTIDTAAQLQAFYQDVPYKYHLVALSEYHNFTPSVTNEARIGFNRYYNITPSGNIPYPGLDSFPSIYIYDQDGLEYGPDGNAPQSTIQNLYQFTDNVSWVKGNHTFKFGFDGRKYISPQSFTQRVRGDYEWSYLSEFLHDLAPTAFGERSTGNFFYYGDQTAFYGFGNDTWRVSPNLTLNLGLRYEFTSVPTGERPQVLNAAASVPGLINFGVPQPQYKNFAPRLGIDYAPDQKTSIRAGFGMAYDVLYDNLGILSFPPQYSSTTDVGGGAPGEPNPGDPNFLAGGGLPAGTGGLASFATIADQQAATSGYVPNQKLPYAETWSLGVQRIFASNYTAEIRYVGTRGIHLSTQDQLNRQARVDANHYLPTYIDSTPSAADLAGLTNTLATLDARSPYVPGFVVPGGANFTSKITTFLPGSESNYNGLQASLVKRLQDGLQLDLSYTYSKTMDDATADVFSTSLTPRRPQDSQNIAGDYSRSALDRTHRLTLEAVYDLPFYKHGNWFLKNTVGNWEIAPIYTYESPEYVTVLSGDDANLNSDSPYTDRAIQNNAGVKGTGSDVSAIYDPSRAALCGDGVTGCNANLVAYKAVNPNAQYIKAGLGALATGGRNTLPLAPINNFDATAVKRFNFTERTGLEFQAQAFNVLNHSQYIPGSVDNIDSLGYTTSISFQEPSNPSFNQPQHFFTANARSMQLALKLTF